MIGEDLIDDFIIYFHKNNIPLNSKIQRSIFEMNSMFIVKNPTLIDYFAYFGSIQIMHYLEINKVQLTPSLPLYAIHSNNPEVILFLEEKQIEMDDKTFSGTIKCNHYDIANLNQFVKFHLYIAILIV